MRCLAPIHVVILYLRSSSLRLERTIRLCIGDFFGIIAFACSNVQNPIMSCPIDEKVLNQLKGEQSELLDKIDELRTIGVGGLVELPQIVVCGNQSSGKSSVLEAISRVRFPAKSSVCTRFATEIVLRRHPFNRVNVSIEPGKSRKDTTEREKLCAFTSESFPLVESAKECMGLSNTDSLASNSGFSDDVLKVEISGPDRPELTLVDLPGLYYSTSSDQGEPGMRIVQSYRELYEKLSRYHPGCD